MNSKFNLAVLEKLTYYHFADTENEPLNKIKKDGGKLYFLREFLCSVMVMSLLVLLVVNLRRTEQGCRSKNKRLC